MSDPMPSIRSMPSSSMPCAISSIPSGAVTTALMQTMPAISGWSDASHTVSAPPIDSPTTTTRSQRAARRWYAASASPSQSR